MNKKKRKIFFALALFLVAMICFFDLNRNVHANTLENNNYSQKIYFSNSDEEINIAQMSGEQFTQMKIQSGDLLVDSEGNLQVTQQWIDRIKATVSPDYEVIADGNAIILINKYEMMSRSGGGVTKLVNTWKGFDLYLKDSHTRNLSDAQQAAAIVTPFVGGPLGSVMGAILQGTSLVINRVNKGNGVIVAFLGKQISPPPIVHWISAQ